MPNLVNISSTSDSAKSFIIIATGNEYLISNSPSDQNQGNTARTGLHSGNRVGADRNHASIRADPTEYGAGAGI